MVSSNFKVFFTLPFKLMFDRNHANRLCIFNLTTNILDSTINVITYNSFISINMTEFSPLLFGGEPAGMWV